MKPVIHPRSQSGGEPAASHLADCMFCGVANGVTAPACWQCGATSWQRKPGDEAASVQSTIVRADVARTQAVILPTLEIEPDDEDFLALARRPAAAHSLQIARPPGAPRSPDMPELADMVSRAADRPPRPGLRLRTMVAMVGGLAVVTLLAALMLFDRYQSNQVGNGWSPTSRHEAAPSPTSAQANELIERAPTGAGMPAATAEAGTAPAPRIEGAAPAIASRDALRALSVAAPAAAAPAIASAPWVCPEGIAALGLCDHERRAARP